MQGRAVFFCTGAGMSGSLGFGAEYLEELGVRLVAIDRPGLGDSDPHADKSLSTWSEDVFELMSVRKFESPLAVGFSQGAPFAYALADAGLVGALAIVSGQDDFSDEHARSLLPGPVAEFVSRVQSRDPGFLEGFARGADADGFFKMILSMSSEKDRELYESEPFQSAYQRSLREGFRAGAAGYVGDLVNSMSPWPFAIEKIAVPVDLWYGGLDENPTHSPDYGLNLARRMPRSARHFTRLEGGSILWTRARDILKTLLVRGELKLRR